VGIFKHGFKNQDSLGGGGGRCPGIFVSAVK